MPRYCYECVDCGDVVRVFHLMSETYTDCQICDTENSMKKKLTTPLKLVVRGVRSNNLKVGEITKEHIEANREILEKEQQKARKETYEPS